MNRIEKFTRIITIPAIVSGLTVLVLYLFADNAMSTADFIVSEVCLLLIAAVYRSSIKLKQHTLPQLLAG